MLQCIQMRDGAIPILLIIRAEPMRLILSPAISGRTNPCRSPVATGQMPADQALEPIFGNLAPGRVPPPQPLQQAVTGQPSVAISVLVRSSDPASLRITM